jgi:hypothetical protein
MGSIPIRVTKETQMEDAKVKKAGDTIKELDAMLEQIQRLIVQYNMKATEEKLDTQLAFMCKTVSGKEIMEGNEYWMPSSLC